MSIKFNGKNYIYWAWSVEVFLRGKWLFDLLYVKPSTSTYVSDATSLDDLSTFNISIISTNLWDQEDNLIMSLMLSSIKPNIGVNLMHLWSAKAI